MKEVIIVGAGIAGLAAANHLRQQGIEAIILEGRERIGGRIHVDHSWGIPVAKGAAWIHGGENNPILHLAKQFNCPIFPYRRQSYNFGPGGKLLADSIVSDFEQNFEQDLNKAKIYASAAEKDCSLAKAVQFGWQAESVDAMQQALLSRRLAFFENYMGESWECLSAKYWDIGGSLAEENFIIGGGYGTILQGLAKECDIRLDVCVNAIDAQGEKIKVLTSQGEFQTEKVIVTLPLGVLKTKKIKFIPELPQAKLRAIDAIGMGLFDIIGLQFPKTFWPADASAIYIYDEQRLQWNVFFNFQEILNQPVLYAYMGGPTARASEALSDQQLINNLLKSLEKIFGKNIPALERYFITRWQADPFSLGSYSYVAVGASAEDFIALGEPVADKLYFAGEATNAHIYDATVHGAYLSGIREAKRILAD